MSESNVADCENCDCTCRKCRDLPDTPAEALQLLDFEVEDLQEHLDGAHEAIWGHCDHGNTSADGRRLELTFRSYNPIHAGSGVDFYNQMPGGEWMEYDCDLTGMPVAVRRGAPIPVVALYETTEQGHESMIECYKIHPDFLKDRRRLFEMLIAKFEDEVFDGVYQARKALDALRFLSDMDDVPGRPTEGFTYPGGEGYEALGNRPLPEEDEK